MGITLTALMSYWHMVAPEMPLMIALVVVAAAALVAVSAHNDRKADAQDAAKTTATATADRTPATVKTQSDKETH